MAIYYGFKDDNLTHVIGVDEVGWGAIAGPLYVGGCIVKIDDDLEWLDIKDSKRYTTERAREIAFINLERWQSAGLLETFSWHIEAQDVADDPASALEICQRCVCSILLGSGEEPDKRAGVIVDGKVEVLGLPACVPVLAVIKADSLFKVVSAASVVAKVERDRDMNFLGKLYPVYNFDKNKGYPTPQHLKDLQQHGPCVEHRTNIAAVRLAAR